MRLEVVPYWARFRRFIHVMYWFFIDWPIGKHRMERGDDIHGVTVYIGCSCGHIYWITKAHFEAEE